MERGAEFNATNVPIGEINVHYDNLYDKLKEAGVFDVKKSEETETPEETKTSEETQAPEETQTNDDPLGLGL